jgi:acyl carrier protein
MKSKEELVHELKGLIIEKLNLQDLVPANFDGELPIFGEGLGLDSIDAIELVVLFEKNYGIKFQDPKDARKVFVNLNTMADYILENQK